MCAARTFSGNKVMFWTGSVFGSVLVLLTFESGNLCWFKGSSVKCESVPISPAEQLSPLWSQLPLCLHACFRYHQVEWGQVRHWAGTDTHQNLYLQLQTQRKVCKIKNPAYTWDHETDHCGLQKPICVYSVVSVWSCVTEHLSPGRVTVSLLISDVIMTSVM